MTKVDTLSALPEVPFGLKGPMHTVQDMKLLPVWVNPDHMVGTARHIMAGHKIRLLGVVDKDVLIGTLSLEKLLLASESAPVSTVVEPLGRTVPSNMPIREAAELFVTEGLDHAPVVDGDKFIGILSANMLLRELRHSWDPLTGLPWSDRLRDWGIENLRLGREITILFLDIDDFGEYNKKYGHIVGDRVLRKVADALSQPIDASKDVLVRYGGDEFAIGTLRAREEADVLAELVQASIARVFLEDSEEPVKFCLGLQGGKRTHERENIHYSSTVDNLINLASREALSKKRQAQESLPFIKEQPEQEQPLPRKARPSIVGVYTDEESSTALTTVILNSEGQVVSGVHQRAGKPVLLSIAIATSKALERLAGEAKLTVHDVLLAEDEDGRLVTVSGTVSNNGGDEDVSATVRLGDDLYTSAAEASIEAFAECLS